jgi:hypothetical protein
MVMKRSASVLIVSTLVALPLIAQAALNVGKSEVTFHAIGPAGMKIDGKSSQLSVSEKDGKITLSVPSDSFKTGIGLRDKHLKGYLKHDKCADITLTIDRKKLKFPADGKPVENVTVPGTLKVACKEKTLDVTYKAKLAEAGKYNVEADMKDVALKDFDIEQPCYLGVCVKEVVPKVSARFVLRDEK